jgi:AcrR family transcriptional regulator
LTYRELARGSGATGRSEGELRRAAGNWTACRFSGHEQNRIAPLFPLHLVPERIPFRYRKVDNLFSQSNYGGAGTLSGNRERILEGMLQAVGTRGYERTSVEDAVEAAGLYRRAFYDSFEDKEACYLEAIEAGLTAIELAMREGAVEQETWRAQLRGALTGLLRFLDEKPTVGRALLVEVHAAGPRAVEKRTEAMERAAVMVDLAREESGARAPEISAEAVVAGTLAVLHTRLSSERPTDFTRLLPELMYLAVLPFFGPDVASAEMQSEEP